jgi:hypothetical protein
MCTRLRCLGSWADHGQQTGGFYKCNRFMPAEVKTIVSAIDKAKADLDRYGGLVQLHALCDVFGGPIDNCGVAAFV